MVHQPILRTNFNPENISIIPSAAKLSTPTQSVWYKRNTCSTDLVFVIKKIDELSAKRSFRFWSPVWSTQLAGSPKDLHWLT